MPTFPKKPFISKAGLYRLKPDKTNLLKGIQQLDAADNLLKRTANDFSTSADRLKLSKLNAFFTEAGMQLVDKLYQVTKDPIYLERAFYYSVDWFNQVHGVVLMNLIVLKLKLSVW